jgi:SPP1 gp7 family putative phage head morphogenesis protein
VASPSAVPKGGKDTPIPAGLLERAIGAATDVVSSFTTGFFPPLRPFQPLAPEAAGRAYDYPFGANLAYQPRGEPGQDQISFAQLRRFAEPAQGGLDLLRLAIETRKDQMVAQKWTIVGRDGADGGKRARDLELMMRRPDGALMFKVWMRQILEDHFVIDAPTVYPRQSSDGVLFEIIDGATIHIVIDERGRTPAPPLPAYQQILKGLPAVNYTTKELGYYASNVRPGRLYGMSRVEQVVGLLTIALNRQLSVLNYYTAGSIPDMLIGVPESWQPAQIKEWQDLFDSILAGQLDARRRARFYPGGMKPFETKGEILKNEFDEWLARLICYCFSLSPETLVKQTNKATAQTAKQSAAEEGLEPTKLWFKDTMDDLLVRGGYAELEWRWADEEIQDPIQKSTVISTYTGGRPIMSLNEARGMTGLVEATPEVLAQLEPLWQGAPDPADDPGGDGKDPSGKKTPPAGKETKMLKAGHGASGGRSLHPLKPNGKLRRRTEKGIGKLSRKTLTAQRDALLEALAERADKVDKLAKRSVSEDDIRHLLRSLDTVDWETAREQLRDLLAAMATDRGRAAVNQITDWAGNRTDDEISQLLDQANERAVAWAEARVGNLIVDVSDTTRDAVNELTAAAIRDGLTNDELADRIRDGFEFSDERADRIARTETAFAETAGALEGYRETGILEKEWDADAEACPECDALDGEIVGIDEPFSDGSDGPPAHPDCRCVVLPVVEAVEEEGSGE